MSRKLMAVFLSSALVFGSVSTSAWSATADVVTLQSGAVKTETVKAPAVANNPSPLPPAGAAGVQEAQGFTIGPLLGVALVVGTVLIIYLLLHEDRDEEEGPSTTTGT
jgi:hypothetical protein